MDAPVSYAREGTVGVVTIDNPPVNALGIGVRKGLVECLEQASSDDAVDIVVLIGGGRTFPVGADINELGGPPAAPGLVAVIEAFEASPKPVLAAIHGTALGGGLELALGCDYRCAAADAGVGLPEVKLGLPPGAGGTQRLPRLIGVAAALRMIVSGATVGAAEAVELGIVDRIVEGDIRAGAVAFAAEIVAEGRPRRRIRDLAVEAPAAAFDDFRKSIARRARGFEAPFLCIDAVACSVTHPFDQGMAREREMFIERLDSAQSKAQRHVFLAERAAARIPDLARDTPVRSIETAGIVGAGTMGAGIAMSLANAGIPVTLVEADRQALERGLAVIAGNYAASVAKGRLSRADADHRMGRIGGSLDYRDLAPADIVIEAVFESMDLKKEVFARLDEVCKAGAILATNTSTLDIDRIAAATGRPQDVIGAHFFSPANVMRLVEIVCPEKVSREVVATTMKLSRTIGKVGVLVGVGDGFVGNRMLHRYFGEAQFLVEQGALPGQVDRVLDDWGWAMGPFAVMDLAGNDVGWRIRKEREPTRDNGLPYPSTVSDRLCERGRFGQKTGAGWYLYEDGGRVPVADPDVEALIVGVSEEKGIARRRISDAEILERCLYSLINAGAEILEQGIARRPGDIDVIYIHGYGFPAYRGGPMYAADRIGLGVVCNAIRRLEQRHGAIWKPAPLLERLAGEGGTFGGLVEAA